ncbi:MAG: D-alanyl-D-alanine carboxypeptidase/D-alanyl-D-alanine-endopeptidase [Planctomycetota bacterium]
MALAVPVSAVDRNAIDRALSHANLEGAHIGVEIFSITTDEVVYSRNARAPLIVASNNKLVATASALHHLGQDYKLSTRIYAQGSMEDHILNGDLLLRGGGDPCLSGRYYPDDALAPLKQLAEAVKAAGIREVRGVLVVDDTLFDREFIAPGWPTDQLDQHYCAPVSGLSLMENLVWVEITPAPQAGMEAKLSLNPAFAPFTVVNQVSTTSKPNENLIHIERPQAEGRLQVNGKTYFGNPMSSFSVPVCDPVAFFGAVFEQTLESTGISVDRGWCPAESSPDYSRADCRLLGAVESDLIQAVILTNKESQNHFAEQLFKLAGWKAFGKGTFSTGEAAARKMFQDLDLEDIDPFTMKDGSGLSRGNSFSPHTLVRLLTAFYRSSLRDPFLRSLPIAGVDGSLEKRMASEPYASRIRGKTGWIREVSALSGYGQSLSGEVFAFSILFNEYKGSNSTMKSIQDSICKALVDS